MAQETSEALNLSALLMRERVRARLLGERLRPVRIERFELKRVCGHGGQGLVYEAFDTVTETHVALKCLHSSLARPRARFDSVRADEQAALQREFRSLSHLVHPNLVAMHELFCADGAWFFTMELIAGVDIVQHVLASADRESATRAAVAQLLRGLAVLHGQGFVHRDIKPSNVLVEPSGRVVLVDYGLVIAQADTEAGRGGAGTPAYMAPEQAEGRAPEPAADLFGVGAILSELLTGKRWDAHCRAHSSVDGPPPGAVVHTIERVRGAAADLDALTRAAPDLAALCRDLLAWDPAARPSASQALARLDVDSVARGALPSAGASEPPTCFVARAAELTLLQTALARALGRGPQIVLVHGESGIGKSALLSRFAEQLAERSSALVLRGRCYERESTPYKVFDGVVVALIRYLNGLDVDAAHALTDDLRQPLLQLFPAFLRNFRQRRSDAPERYPAPEAGGDTRSRAFAALRELLLRIARESPVVLMIDDLQWADLDSVPMLEALFAPGTELPLLLVGSYRRDEAETSPFLARLLGPRTLLPPLCELTQLGLSALGADDARLLVSELAPARAATALVASARGVPFLLVEAALAEVELARPDCDSVDVGELFAARVDVMNERAQALLALLSVAGRPLSVALATHALADVACGFETVLELASRRLVRFRDLDGERCLEPYHDRVRELVTARLDPARVRALHLAIDAALERLGADDPLRRVEHLRAAGEHTRAAALAIRAAEVACAQLAWSRAADLLNAALELSECDSLRLRQKLGDVLSYAGRHAESAAAYMRATYAAHGDEHAALWRLAAGQYLRAGHTSAGLSLFDKALARTGIALPRSQLRASVALLSARVRAPLTRSVPRALQTALRSCARGRASTRMDTSASNVRRERLATLQASYRELWLSHPVQSALAHTWYCAEAMRGSPRERIEALTAEIAVRAISDGQMARRATTRLLREAEALTSVSAEPYEVALLQFSRALAAIHTEWRPRAAIAPLEQADALLRTHCPGTDFERAWIALALDSALEITGQLAKLCEVVRARERCASEHAGHTRALRMVSVPLVLLIEDRAQEAFELVVAHTRERRAVLPLLDSIVLFRAATALLYGGAPRSASEYFEAERQKLGFQLALRSRTIVDSDSFLRARNAAALYWTAREPLLRRQVEQRVARARKLPPLARAHFWLLEASIARCDRRTADARALLAAALRDLEGSEGEHGAWCVRYRQAQLERSAEQLAHARAWFVAEGVREPERWVSLSIPGVDGWG